MRRILNILSNNRAPINVGAKTPNRTTKWDWFRGWVPITLTILVGVFLRFYKLYGFTTFLGDQGRDAIVVKRILTMEHFPAIGAPTSIGQVYLGPFYYYFIAPWLLFFNNQPIGLAFGVAFFSSLYLLINYLIVKELFNNKAALISTVFLSFSSFLIDFSRFSWNPNLLPLFTLLTVYFVIKSLKTNKWYFFVLLGSFISFSIQLHYLALFLIPPIVTLLINDLIKRGKVKAPIVIGRDHLDTGSVASPNRETEGMKDGSDAIADWPLLNFALNTAAGASWVSFHNGGGVGIGNSLHAGMVIVADGTKEREKRLERVLTVDPGIGVARHADAGYQEAIRTAKNKKLVIPK